MRNRVRARIDATAIAANYRALHRAAGAAEVCAVVKADAYGHGLSIVAPALVRAGCRRMAVTDVAEAIDLLALLDARGLGDAVRVLALAGALDLEDARAIADEPRIEPAVFDADGLDRLQRTGFAGRVWLKVETGMHRLGADDPTALARRIVQAGIGIAAVFSHLACAATPSDPRNRRQVERMIAAARAIDAPRSLANSAAIAAMPAARFEIVRPGIALYGVEPVARAPLGVRPAMRFEGRVLQLRTLRRGDAVSYDARFIAPGPMRIAVVAAGYADGLPRALGNLGEARDDRGRRLPIVGRVCMDHTMIDVGNAPDLRPGDWVSFWGAHGLRVEDQAARIGTIAYELLTGVAARVPRIEEEGCCADCS